MSEPSYWEYGGELHLVGISYDKDALAGERRHSCRIVKYNIEMLNVKEHKKCMII